MSFAKTWESWWDSSKQIPPENRLDLSVSDLGRYYAYTQTENEIKHYSFDDSLIDLSGLLSKLNTTKPESDVAEEVQAKIRSILSDTSEGALLITDIMEKLNTEVGDVDRLEDRIVIRFETVPSGIPGSGCKANATENKDDNVGIAEQCSLARMVPGEPSHEELAAAALEGTTAGPTQSLVQTPPTTGNDPGAPADRIDNPWMSSIQVNDVRLTPANRRNMAGSIFFNGIPTIEMSQCAPFISLTFVSELDTFADGSKAMTLYGFSEGSPDASLFSMPDFATGRGVNLNGLTPITEASNNNQFDLSTGRHTGIVTDIFDPNLGDENITVEIGKKSNAGIELFQAPQTLNNVSNGGEADVGGVINPTAPFASLERLTVDISGLGLATLANKTAAMDIVLHDRSRLPLIAPLVGASSYAGTYVIIEYGWSHTQATGAGVGNVYADFLNSLRSKSAFNIQVANLSMLEDGQVRISLRLASRGVGDMATVPAASGVSHVPASAIAPFLSRIGEIINQSKTGYYENLISQTLDMAAAGRQSAVEDIMVHRSTLLDVQQGFSAIGGYRSPTVLVELDAYRSLLRLLRQPDQGAEAIEQGATIIRDIIDLMDANEEDKWATLRDGLNEKHLNISTVDIFNDGSFSPPIQQRIDLATATGAPSGTENSTNGENNIGFTDAPSLGSVLLSYMGRPLQATGRYDEVQFHFYPFNKHASYMAGQNIANFPLIGFTSFLSKIATERPGISASSFAEALFRDDCGPENQSHEMYGMSTYYDQLTSDALKGLEGEARRDEINNVRRSMEIELQRIYRDVLQLGNNRLGRFDIPDITVLTECIPVKMPELGSVALSTKTILRIHVFDAKSGIPYEADLLSQINAQGQLAVEVLGGASEAQSPNEIERQTAEDSAINANLRARVDQFIEDGSILRSDEIEIEDSSGGSVQQVSYISAMPAKKIKEAIKSVYPSITFGTQFTNVFSVGMSSNTGGAVNQVLLLNAIEGDNLESGASQSSTAIEDVFVIPTNATLQTAGFPMVTYGQKYFIDMGTGTTADNFYYVVGIRHTIGPGLFESTLNMTFNGSATVRSIKNALTIAAEAEYG